jgi:HEAT repeat protein
MTEDSHLPFAEVLPRLFDDEAVSIPLLFRLSDMLAEETALFEGRWPTVSAERRAAVAQHMADIAEDNFEVDFSPVFGFMLKDPLPEVRRAALDGLWDTTNLNLVRPIMNMTTGDPVLSVQTAATKTLAHFVMMGVWGQIPRAVKNRVVEWLVPLYADVTTPPPVRCAALEALGPADHEAVPRFIRAAYESGDLAYQASALFAMGTSADPAWLPTVVEELRSPYVELRLEAARACGEIGRSAAVEPLQDQLFFEDDFEVQAAIVLALGKIGSDQARRILQDCLEDEEMADLHEVIEAAFEEIDWMSQSLDMFDLEWDDGDLDFEA